MNTGMKPSGITSVSPWSGFIWDTANYQERLPKGGDGPFEVGYMQYEEWEMKVPGVLSLLSTVPRPFPARTGNQDGGTRLFLRATKLRENGL